MASNTDDIDQTDDGILMASGWFGYSCDSCGCYHIDLLDNKEKPFATMVIEEHDLEKVAHMLLNVAAKMASDRLYNPQPFTRH
jgi:hypothetical protein